MKHLLKLSLYANRKDITQKLELQNNRTDNRHTFYYLRVVVVVRTTFHESFRRERDTIVST